MTRTQTHQSHSLAVFGWTFVALCILTCFSLFTYTDYWHRNVPQEVGWLMMMAVSCTKAFLVATFFMHLWWERNWKYVLTVPASIVSVVLVLLLIPDIGLRSYWYSAYRWRHAAEPMPYWVGPQYKIEPFQYGAHETGHSESEHEADAGRATDALSSAS